MKKAYFWFNFKWNWFCFLIVIIFGQFAIKCVEIRRLLVPRWVQNGTADSIILDCEYVYNENDFRLVVKWFFKDNLEPVYQWIPELGTRYTSGVLTGKLDLNFSVNSVDAYSKFRALKIRSPSVELSGEYTCLVTSLAGQDSRAQNMTVFVPANHFDVTFEESQYGLTNVTCEGRGLFPVPMLRLYSFIPGVTKPKLVPDVQVSVQYTKRGAYDIYLHRTFSDKELSSQGDVTLECVLELPGTNYVKAKKIGYYHGIQGQRIGDSRVSIATNQRPSLIMFLLLCLCLNLIGRC